MLLFGSHLSGSPVTPLPKATSVLPSEPIPSVLLGFYQRAFVTNKAHSVDTSKHFKMFKSVATKAKNRFKLIYKDVYIEEPQLCSEEHFHFFSHEKQNLCV